MILGPNGRGKTTVLESAFLLFSLQSFRTPRLHELISYQQNEAFVDGIVDYPGEFHRHNRVTLEKSGDTKTKKQAFVDQKLIGRRSSYLLQNLGTASFGQPVVVFHPQDHRLLDGEPNLRRHYLDALLHQLDPTYVNEYQRYHRALLQRNAIFKNRERSRQTELESEQFLEVLIDSGAYLYQARALGMKRLAHAIQGALKSTLNRDLSIEYEWRISLQTNTDSKPDFESVFDRLEEINSVQKLKHSWRELSLKNRSQEWHAKSTLFGPHRDDFALSSQGRPLKETGSQGEKRTVILGMKLAEVQLLEAQPHTKRPVLIVDDFSSELDQEKRALFLNFMSESKLQVLMSTTEAPGGNPHLIRI